MTTVFKRIAQGVVLVMLCFGTQAFAEYPEKTIRLIVPYPAGGATDTLARHIAQSLTDTWGKPVIVDNRPGASGISGSNLVVRSKKDGYTLLLGIVALAQLPALYSSLPFDVSRDFAPLTEVARSQNLLLVPKSLGVDTFEEFLALVKSQPGQHTYGSYGNGTSSHIYGEILKKQTGMDLVHVPYRGSAPLITDVLGERLSLAIVDGGSIRPHLDSDRFKVIGVTGSSRYMLAPDAPTLTELGYKHFESNGWFGLFAPRGVPEPILDKIANEVSTIVRSEEMAVLMNNFGLIPAGHGRDAFKQVVSDELKLWTDIIGQTGIKIE